MPLTQHAPIEKSEIKPFLKWAGGKRFLIPQLLPLFPANYQRYMEPFVGGGAVYFALHPLVPSFINDLNSELVATYQVVCHNPHGLATVLDSMEQQYSKEYYYEVRKQCSYSLLQRAARMIFLNKTCFNGLYRVNARNEFNVPFGKRVNCPKLYDDNLFKASKQLTNTHITHGDFESLIDKSRSGDFIYVDPPYDPVNKTSNFTSYQKEKFTPDDHLRLQRACQRAWINRGVSIVISNSDTEFIRRLYSEAEIHTIKARRSINCNGAERGEITELAIVMRGTAYI